MANEEACLRKCPKCGATMRVTDTREHGSNVWRRRTCASCGYKHSTIEMLLDEFNGYASKEALIDDTLQGIQKVLSTVKPGILQKK